MPSNIGHVKVVMSHLVQRLGLVAKVGYSLERIASMAKGDSMHVTKMKISHNAPEKDRIRDVTMVSEVEAIEETCSSTMPMPNCLWRLLEQKYKGK